jgi:timeless
MEDLLLYLASADSERQFSLHVLEIISLMFREQTPEQLASAGGPRALSERERDQQELAMIREQEKAEKRAQIIKHSSR